MRSYCRLEMLTKARLKNTIHAVAFNYYYTVVKNETQTITHPDLDTGISTHQARHEPLLFVCHAPDAAVTSDRVIVRTPLTVGRSSKATMTVDDGRMSKIHFTIEKRGETYTLKDLNSTNHTWLNGEIVQQPMPLTSGSVIRAGNTILCFESQRHASIEPAPLENYGITGKYYLHKMVARLREAAVSERHILICGPSGSGKELAARALTQMYSEQFGPMHMVSHNAARFSSEEEAASTLFGIASNTFTGVGARIGLIEQADGGVLFLDEIHNLPTRVQRSLLRVMEDSVFSRIGETATRRVSVRFIFASNDLSGFHGMAPDMYSRCRELRVLGLNHRRADIPTIFKNLLFQHAERHALKGGRIWAHISNTRMEALCLNDFSTDNVRGIIDLCDRIVTRIKVTHEVENAIDSVFTEQFAHSPVFLRARDTFSGDKANSKLSEYERNRTFISNAFTKCNGNFSAMERLLKSSGINCSRRWLKIYADKWQLKL